MENRLKLLHEEEQNLEAVRRVCENLRQCHLPFDSVSEAILEEDEASWGEQLAKVLKEDITKEILTPKQFNKKPTKALPESKAFVEKERMLLWAKIMQPGVPMQEDESCDLGRASVRTAGMPTSTQARTENRNSFTRGG